MRRAGTSLVSPRGGCLDAESKDAVCLLCAKELAADLPDEMGNVDLSHGVGRQQFDNGARTHFCNGST